AFNQIIQNDMNHIELLKPLIRQLLYESIIPIQQLVCKDVQSVF
ncbi:4732_t:CDS:1, partial [Funneliformis geosporum]